MDTSKIVVPNRVPFVEKDFKYFIGYEEGEKVRFLCIMLPKMSPYRRDFDETDYISLLKKNDALLEKYSEIWYKSDCDLVYKDKYM